MSFSIGAGETVALVGESGSGKSVTALSVLKLLPYPASLAPERQRLGFDGKDLLAAGAKPNCAIRGNDMSMIFQEPMTSLNPLHDIERQIGEMLTLHKGLKGTARRERISNCCARSAFPTRNNGSVPIRTNSRAASASAS
jgi:microcin C transport system ATP-binding protein